MQKIRYNLSVKDVLSAEFWYMCTKNAHDLILRKQRPEFCTNLTQKSNKIKITESKNVQQNPFAKNRYNLYVEVFIAKISAEFVHAHKIEHNLSLNL